MAPLRIVSLFSGCGGMDLGFEQEGHYTVVWANDTNGAARKTYAQNRPGAVLDGRSLRDIPSADIPDCEGVIGGPPCQPFSSFGARRGEMDPRGTLAFEFVRVVADKLPRFFVLENVAALATDTRHKGMYNALLTSFQSLGYVVRADVLVGTAYGLAQSRRRLFIVGVRSDQPGVYEPPKPRRRRPRTMRDVIGDLSGSARPTNGYQTRNPKINAHEYVPLATSPLSRWFLGAQRVREWDKPSYTIVASLTSIVLHPSCPKLIRHKHRDYRLAKPKSAYRRMTARECARLQGFPDTFLFEYTSITPVYRLIGNAVPPPLARVVAQSVYRALR